MFINQLKIKNFRCFTDSTFSFDKRFVLIEGVNGSGKTTLLEALYYACYLRSFRTHLTKELVHLGRDPYFYIQVDFDNTLAAQSHHIQIGASDNEKVVKFDDKALKTYKEIISQYRIISLSEEDLALVQGAPEERRAFLNQSIVLSNPDYLNLLRTYKQIVHNRNTLLLSLDSRKSNRIDELIVWTEQLWECSLKIQAIRRDYLATLEKLINDIIQTHFAEQIPLYIMLAYQPKYPRKHTTFQDFWATYEPLHLEQEIKLKRSCFGAHLDDIAIEFQDKKARVYASRGQQKLVVFLLKIAQIYELNDKKEPCSLLLDDFLTDFDHNRLNRCMELLAQLSAVNQVFMTCPVQSFIKAPPHSTLDIQSIQL